MIYYNSCVEFVNANSVNRWKEICNHYLLQELFSFILNGFTMASSQAGDFTSSHHTKKENIYINYVTTVKVQPTVSLVTV